ncbi:hypothetical protein [Streptomyces sp. NPDC052610]|uniref:hypothetical protein n=1 Tax=Streptomyces sp. NPDC052610 TaxID=3154952 RepID=UPI00341C0596
MRPAVRVLIVTALAAAVVGGNAPAVLAEPAAEVSPGRAAPDGDVTVSVTCDDLGGTPPDTLEATSRAFEDGLVELRLADGQEGTATGPVYRGTARIALPEGAETEEADSEGAGEDEDGGEDEGVAAEAEAEADGQGESGQDSAWTVDGTCPAASGAQGKAFSASFTVAPDSVSVSPDSVTVAPDSVTVAPDSVTVAPDSVTVAPDSADALAAAPSDGGPATAPLDEGAATAPLDEGSAKIPLDEDAAKIPLDEDAAKIPLDEGAAKTPLDEGALIGGGRAEAPLDSSSCTDPEDRGCKETGQSTGGRAEEPRKPEPCPDLKDPNCGTAVIQRGVRAGEGGAFDTSVPALVAGGVLIAGAFGGAVYRLRGKAPRGEG